MSDPSTLPERLRTVGLRQKDLALYLNMHEGSLTRLIHGKRSLKVDEAAKIERFFETAAATNQHGQHGSLDTPPQFRTPPRIEVYGYLAEGVQDHRILMTPGAAIESLDTHPLCSGLGELLGLRIVGDEMEPRLRAGETVIAQRGRPPLPRDDVIVEFTDGAGVVRNFVSETPGGAIVCRQFNPPAELIYPRETVKRLHAVLWRK